MVTNLVGNSAYSLVDNLAATTVEHLVGYSVAKKAQKRVDQMVASSESKLAARRVNVKVDHLVAHLVVYLAGRLVN